MWSKVQSRGLACPPEGAPSGLMGQGPRQGASGLPSFHLFCHLKSLGPPKAPCPLGPFILLKWKKKHVPTGQTRKQEFTWGTKALCERTVAMWAQMIIAQCPAELVPGDSSQVPREGPSSSADGAQARGGRGRGRT